MWRGTQCHKSAHETAKAHWTHLRCSVPAAVVHLPNTKASCLSKETIDSAGVACLLSRHALHSWNKIWFAPFFLFVFSDNDLSEFLSSDNYLNGIVGKLLSLVLANPERSRLSSAQCVFGHLGYRSSHYTFKKKNKKTMTLRLPEHCCTGKCCISGFFC